MHRLHSVGSATELARLSRAPGAEPLVKRRRAVAGAAPECDVRAAISNAKLRICSVLQRIARQARPRAAAGTAGAGSEAPLNGSAERARLHHTTRTEPSVNDGLVVACTTPECEVRAAINNAELGVCSLLQRIARQARPRATAGTAGASNEVPHGREAETTGAQPILPLGRVLAWKEVAEAGRAITRPVWPEEARLRRLLGTVPDSAPPEPCLGRHGRDRARS